jgi:hypothetical protein
MTFEIYQSEVTPIAYGRRLPPILSSFLRYARHPSPPLFPGHSLSVLLTRSLSIFRSRSSGFFGRVTVRFWQRRSAHSTKISGEPHRSYPPQPVMSQEHIKNTRKRPLSFAVTPSQPRPFVGATPNMLPSNPPPKFESIAMDGQAFLPPALPHDQIKLPDKLAHWPSFTHLKLPYTNSYPNLKAQRQQHPLPYTMSHSEHNPDTGAKRIGPGPPATPTQGNSLTNVDRERHDSLTKGHVTHTSPTSSVPSGWIGSRLPSSNIPRKAPLAARSSDEISPLIAEKYRKRSNRDLPINQRQLQSPHEQTGYANRSRSIRSYSVLPSEDDHE